MTLRVYAGPILIVPRTNTLKTIGMRTCPNKSCEKSNINMGTLYKFCDQCGSAIQYENKELPEYSPSFWDISNLLEKAKLAGDSFYYKPPEPKDPELILLARQHKFHIVKPQRVSIDKINAKEDIEWFQAYFKEQIELIEEAYPGCQIDCAIITFDSK